jgi:single-stranded DNA-binding protein
VQDVTSASCTEIHMARDTNLSIVVGQLVDEPEINDLKNSKKSLLFTLKNVERFELADGQPGSHENFLLFEVLGRNVDVYARSLTSGMRYEVTGYLRSGKIRGVERVWIRCFSIQSAE